MSQLTEDGTQLLGTMLDVIQNANPGMVHLCMALLFGSICADAELQGCPSDSDGLVDMDQRLRLFTIIAKTSYRESGEMARKLRLYGKGH